MKKKFKKGDRVYAPRAAMMVVNADFGDRIVCKWGSKTAVFEPQALTHQSPKDRAAKKAESAKGLRKAGDSLL